MESIFKIIERNRTTNFKQYKYKKYIVRLITAIRLYRMEFLFPLYTEKQRRRIHFHLTIYKAHYKSSFKENRS